MSKHIDILFTCPPSLDFPQLIQAQDADGSKLDVGRWIPPDDVEPFWRFRLSIAELVVKLVTPEQEFIEQITGVSHHDVAAAPGRTPAATIAPAGTAADQRAALRSKLGNATRKASTPVVDAPAAIPPGMIACTGTNCGKPADTQDTCIGCGEARCDSCRPNAAQPCLDCAALDDSPDEGGFDPHAVPDTMGLKGPMPADLRGGGVNPALFDNTFRGKDGSASTNEDDE